MTATLLPVTEAQARLFALAPPVEAEAVPLAQAAGRWASADVLAALAACVRIADEVES